MSRIVESNLPCPNCSSSDAYALYDDGHGYCFSCTGFVRGDATDDYMESRSAQQKAGLITDGYYDLIGRGLTIDTLKMFGYQGGIYSPPSKPDGKSYNIPCQIAPFYDLSGTKLVAQKIRMAGKAFAATGDLDKAGLFGQQLWKPGGKRLVITEGEIDAMSYAQVMGLGWEVVSIPNGVNSGPKAIRRNLEFVDSFAEVVFLFDSDEKGMEAAKVCAELITPGRAKIAKLPLKDANDMLVANRIKELKEAVWNAVPYRPDGILLGSDISLDDLKTAVPRGLSYQFPGLDAKLHGIRKREIVMFTAGSGVGKSTMVKEIGYHLTVHHGKKVGCIFLEESYRKSGQSFVAIDNNVPLIRLQEEPDCISDEAWATSYEKCVVPNAFYDSWGSSEVEHIMNKARYLAVGLQCDFIILDHVSMVVSGLDVDERKTLDMLMTSLRQFVENTDVGLIAVCHLARRPGKTYTEGSQISLSDLRGSAGIEQISDIVIAQERNQQDESEPDVHTIRVLKNRPVGKLGTCGYAKYHETTGRLLPHSDLVAPEQEPPATAEAPRMTF